MSVLTQAAGAANLPFQTSGARGVSGAVNPSGANGAQLVLRADFRARAADNVDVVSLPGQNGNSAAVPADIRSQFIQRYDTYRQSLENAKSMCLDAGRSTDSVIGQLGGLLGSGIAQIAGGGVGAAAGGVNLALTAKTIDAEAELPDLQKKVEDAKAALKKAEQEKLKAVDNLAAEIAECKAKYQ